ncbi:MAG: ComEC/Rec2 family competence protein [Mycobacterium sp.]
MDHRATDLRLVPAALTSWVVTAAGIVWGPIAAVFAVVAAMAVAMIVAMVTYRWWRGGEPSTPPPRWPAVVAVATVGVAFALSVGLRVNDVRHHPISAHFGATAGVVVTPTESPRFLAGTRLLFRGTLQSFDGLPMTGRVVVFASAVDFGDVSAGRPARFRADVGRPTRQDLTVAVLTATGAPTLGTASVVQRAAGAVRARFADAARAALPADQAAMLPALVLGDTTALDGVTVAEFRSAGLTHLTAVSGANVTIVCGAVLLTAGLVGPRLAVALAAVALVAFVIVVQPSASVLRAAVMGAIALFAVVSRRRRQAIPALAASVLVLMVGSPELAVDLGFALSVSATAALVVVAPGWARRLTERGWPEPLAAAVSVATAAQLVTAPLVAGLSGTFSVVSIAANLLVAVVIAPITILGTMAAVLSTSIPAVARLVIRFTGPELWWLMRVADVAAAVPGGVVPTPSGLVGVLTVAGAAIVAVGVWRLRAGRLVVAAALAGLMAWTIAGHGDGHGVGAVGGP